MTDACALLLSTAEIDSLTDDQINIELQRITWTQDDQFRYMCPSYASDLNVVNDMEGTLIKRGLMTAYRMRLFWRCDQDANAMLHAEARERCKAAIFVFHEAARNKTPFQHQRYPELDALVHDLDVIVVMHLNHFAVQRECEVAPAYRVQYTLEELIKRLQDRV